jgi:hypothetical protein
MISRGLSEMTALEFHPLANIFPLVEGASMSDLRPCRPIWRFDII